MPRKHELEVRLDATPDEVWQLIAESDGITRWFAPIAKVEPGESVTLSWGPGMEGTAPIRIWEPGRTLVIEEGPKLVEYHLEAAEGGGTVLRLVQSGFGDDAKFDDEFEATSGGWRSFLALLRHDAALYKGQPSRQVFVTRFVNRPAAELMAEVQAKLGFERSGSEYTATLPPGVPIRGSVLYERGSGYLMLTIDNGGALGLFAESFGDATALTVSAYLKAGMVAEADRLQLETLLP